MKKFIYIFWMIVLCSTVRGQWVSINGPSNDLRCLAASGHNLFAGTMNGVYLTTNSGSSWTEINNGLSSTRIDNIDAFGSKIVVVTNDSNLFISFDNGTNWASIRNGIPQNQILYDVKLIGSSIYLTSNGRVDYSHYVSYSSNNGSSWITLFNYMDFDYFLRAIDVSGSNIIAGNSETGVFISTNNGLNWNWNFEGTISQNSVLISDNDFLSGSDYGLFKSTNLGINWNLMHSFGLYYSLIEAEGIVFVNRYDFFQGIGFFPYYSIDRGTNWFNFGQGLSSGNGRSLAATVEYVFADGGGGNLFRRPISDVPPISVIQPNGDEFLYGAINYEIKWAATSAMSNIRIEFSSNNGQSWNLITTSYPASQRSFNWLVPNNINSSICKIKLTDINNIDKFDISDSNFTITQTLVLEKWIKYYNGPANSFDKASSISVDEAGNVFVTGQSYGYNGFPDYATLMYNSHGTQKWVHRYSGMGNSYDIAKGIDCDKFGNIYVTGDGWISSGSSYSFNFTTLKYDSSGNQEWTRTYQLPENSGGEVSSIACDNPGNIFVTGYIGLNQYTTKYEPNGNQEWIQIYNGSQLGGSPKPESNSTIAIDNQGNVIVLGNTGGVNTSEYQYLTIKYSNSGIQQWARLYNGSTSRNQANAIDVDINGNIYVTGGSIETGGHRDYTTIKYSPSGDLLWVRKFNGNYGGDDLATSIAVDDMGNSYVAGISKINQQVYQCALIKYNTLGVQLWTKNDSALSSTYSQMNIGVKSSMLGDGIFITGIVSGDSGRTVTCKYDSSGSKIWEKKRLGNVSSLVLDRNDNVYLCGNITQSIANGGENYLAMKYENPLAISPSLSLIQPNGGENFSPGSLQNIIFTNNSVSNIKIEYSSNNGGIWNLINANYSTASGSYAWTVPNVISTQCKIKISDINSSANDLSDYTFNIVNSTSSVSGKIKNSSTNNPVSGANIILTSQYNSTYQSNTNDSGNYFINNVPSGNYSIKITKTGYREKNENTVINNGVNLKNYSLTPNNINELVLSENKLTIYANNITTLENDHFKLTGNVNINGILYFSGEVKVDKRSSNYLPVIESSSQMTAKNIQGSDKTFMNTELLYKLIVDGNDLIPQSFGYLFEMPIQIGQIPLKLVGITINNEGTTIELSTLAKFPDPLDKLAGWAIKKNTGEEDFNALKRIMNTFSGKLIYDREQGQDYQLNFSLPNKLKLDFFDLDELSLSWNSSTQVFVGGINIKIPGSLNIEGDNINNSGSQRTLQYIPIEFVDRNGNLLYRTDIDKLHEVLPSNVIEALFALRFEIEIREGRLERVSTSLSDVQIPFGIPGVFITQINADVENLTAGGSNILIRLTCDIDFGLDKIPLIGTPVSLDNAGGEMVPSSYVKLRTGLKFFNQPFLRDASAEFNYRDAFVSLKGEVNVLDIILGTLNSTIKYKYFSGEITGTLKTPASFLHPRLKFLNIENKVFSNARIAVENNVITAQSQINFPIRIPVAARLTFGNPIKVEIGTNFDNLIQIFRSNTDNSQTVSFTVPPNTPGILIVAENGSNLFNFILEDPFGRVYDSLNAGYKSYDDIKQTIMFIENPKAGDWDFITSQAGPVDVYTMGVNQSPSQIINTPTNRNTMSSSISLKVNDYSDTVDINVYYDNDNKNFDGSLIKKFRIINNVNLNFEWNNQDVPDGEYYIYTVVSDGKNAPFAQYAPGSIMVNNSSFEEKPQGITGVQSGDSIRLNWNTNMDQRINFTKIFYQNLSNNVISYGSVADTNIANLFNLSYGKKYRIWTCFVDTSGNYGPSSDSVEVLFKDFYHNNPPCFIAGNDSVWTFIEGETKKYSFNAIDADGNSLNYFMYRMPLGLSISGRKLQWMPSSQDIGLHYFTIVASDGMSLDTLRKQVLVRSEKEAAISVKFSSANLYEQDNKFVFIRNIRMGGDNASLIVKNLRTSQESYISCRRINESIFTSEISISTTQNSLIPVMQGDTIQAVYNFNGTNYIAFSVYDTSSQATDLVPPAPITDLTSSSAGLNKIKLQWTATGDNGNMGEALKYDIRYAYSPITDESSFLSANRFNNYPYPSTSGSMDSMIFDISELTEYLQHDNVYFSIKAEDAYQNRSSLGNSPGQSYIYSATQLRAYIYDVYKININWTGVEGALLRIRGKESDAATFHFYRLFRQSGSASFELIKDSLTQTSYSDNLFYFPDSSYKYALQAVYDIGNSDTIYSDYIPMNRFSDIRISCNVNTSGGSSDSISVVLSAMDTIYAHSLFALTGPAGLVSFSDIFDSKYIIKLNKSGLSEIIDTITISDSTNQFSYNFETTYKVRLVTEGYYDPEHNLLRKKDTVRAYLRNIVPPFVVVDSSISILDSVSQYADFKFENASNGIYYIVIKHRNSIETWSKSGGEIFTNYSSMEYDFTSDQNKAYGNNQTFIDPIWCIYSGDVNQNGLIDLTDIVSIYNDATIFSSGYFVTDLNGDNFTDLTDLLLAFNNSTKFVTKITP